MKKIRFNSTWLVLASALLDVVAIIVYASGENTAVGSIFLCAGATMQIAGVGLARREREKEEAIKKQTEEENTKNNE